MTENGISISDGYSRIPTFPDSIYRNNPAFQPLLPNNTVYLDISQMLSFSNKRIESMVLRIVCRYVWYKYTHYMHGLPSVLFTCVQYCTFYCVALFWCKPKGRIIIQRILQLGWMDFTRALRLRPKHPDICTKRRLCNIIILTKSNGVISSYAECQFCSTRSVFMKTRARSCSMRSVFL